ncbi:MAG: DegT/DnrJ/EryC1/StrS family aminotransferase [Candidatus Nealsonbacteria bacterium]|nr:DegT/DnrJ/EryC1/StrS family aminotransferase [Candidatus Nealsonbacteria bacterium]
MIKIAQPIIKEEEIRAVEKVLKSGIITQGPMVVEFEKWFANFCGTKYAVAVNSGTAALHCALYATGIKERDEIITTPFTFAATANSIIMQRAKPVFVDILPDTFNIDPTKIEEKITQKTKAILPVDLYGQIYEVEAVNKIAKKYKLKIIEDACQAHGAEFNHRKAGAFGEMGCFSFYATKNMTTCEGGMIVTNSGRYAELARRFRHHGQSEKTHYQYFDLGFNYRMTDIAAAIGIEQLKRIDDFNKKRMRNAQMLTERLKNIKGLITPIIKKNYKHVFHQYTIRVTNEFKITRDELSQCLKEKGIGNSIFYPKPLHLYPYFRKLGYKKGDFPISEKISKEVLSLPVHPLVSEEDIKFIIKTIKEI